MEIESKDVSGGTTDNPVFTERTIKGTARIQNNKTLLLASVAQNVESNGRQGLPLLGLIPFIGRLFTAPTRDNRQVDIVIAITPRVIRAPAILPEDEVERSTGSIATPTGGSLESMIRQEEREEYLAASRRLPTKAVVQLPDRPADGPEYVRNSDTAANTTETAAGDTGEQPAVTNTAAEALNLKPIDTSARKIDLGKTSQVSLQSFVPTSAASQETAADDQPMMQGLEPAATPNAASPTALDADISFAGQMPRLKKGETAKIPLNVMSSAPFRSAVVGLKFDQRKVAIRSVSFGEVFGTGIANTTAAPFLNQNGLMYVSLSMPSGEAYPTGVLAYIEIEALADGVPNIKFEKDVLNFLSADGRNFKVTY
jgi:hypothetical protein